MRPRLWKTRLTYRSLLLLHELRTPSGAYAGERVIIEVLTDGKELTRSKDDQSALPPSLH